MNTALKLEQKYSFNEYLKLEKETHEKHDFFYGEVYNMAGGTKLHNKLIHKITFSLNSKLNKKDCEFYSENIKLELKKDKYYVYPDIMITCNKDDLKDDKETIIKNPVIIIEVLSDSTELYDRNTKKRYYLDLPSVKYYLLVSQNENRIEMYEKINSHIEFFIFEKLDEIINFKQLDFKIKFSEIYQV